MDEDTSGETVVEQEDDQFDVVRDLSVPADEADGYLHIGVDQAHEPIEGDGYWIPVAGDDVQRDHVPEGHVVQFPKDDREPERRGPKDVPDWVDNWDRREEVA